MSPARLRRSVGALSGALIGMLVAGLLAAAALLPAGAGHDGRLGPAPVSAAIVLDRAARTALSQAAVYPTARQYEYMKVQEGYTTSVSEGRVGVRFWQSDTKCST